MSVDGERCPYVEKVSLHYGIVVIITCYCRKVESLENEMEGFKKEYVYLLQSSVRIPLHEHSACDAVQVKLFGGAVVRYSTVLKHFY